MSAQKKFVVTMVLHGRRTKFDIVMPARDAEEAKQKCLEYVRHNIFAEKAVNSAYVVGGTR